MTEDEKEELIDIAGDIKIYSMFLSVDDKESLEINKEGLDRLANRIYQMATK